MKGIAALVGKGARLHLFWLDSVFKMKALSPERGFGFDLNFGGPFTSVPAAALS